MSLDISLIAIRRTEVFEANVTHNLGKMAREAGIYEYIWRPEEKGITKAGDLIIPLQEGLAKMKADPDKYIALEPENKWGTYEHFIPWIEKYIKACQENPDATIDARR